MLLIITPNPAVDRTMVVPHVQPGSVLRAERVLVAAGGKGLNVARAATSLGQPVRVCAPLGGFMGDYVAHLAAEEGIVGQWSYHHAGETRTCVLVVDPYGHDATALNEPGPPLDADDWQAFMQTVHAAAAVGDASLATISGSLPPGVPPSAAADLVRTLSAAGCRVVVDTSGATLIEALRAKPYAVKVNRSELGAALGMAVETIHQAVAALQHLRTQGIMLAIVTLGSEGAVAIADEGVCHVCPPALKSISTVGSGDSLLAGLTTALLRGESLADALCLGVACGSADALTIGGGLIDLADVERIRAGTTVQWH